VSALSVTIEASTEVWQYLLNFIVQESEIYCHTVVEAGNRGTRAADATSNGGRWTWTKLYLTCPPMLTHVNQIGTG